MSDPGNASQTSLFSECIGEHRSPQKVKPRVEPRPPQRPPTESDTQVTLALPDTRATERVIPFPGRTPGGAAGSREPSGPASPAAKAESAKSVSNAERNARRKAERQRALGVIGDRLYWEGRKERGPAMETWSRAVLNAEPPLRCMSIRLAFALTTKFDSSGQKGCWEKNDGLARAAGLSIGTVKQAKAELVRRGYLVGRKERRGARELHVIHPARPRERTAEDDIPW